MSDLVFEAIGAKLKQMNRPQKADGLARAAGISKEEIKPLLEQYVKEGKLAEYDLGGLKNTGYSNFLPMTKEEGKNATTTDKAASLTSTQYTYYGFPDVEYSGGFNHR